MKTAEMREGAKVDVEVGQNRKVLRNGEFRDNGKRSRENKGESIETVRTCRNNGGIINKAGEMKIDKNPVKTRGNAKEMNEGY